MNFTKSEYNKIYNLGKQGLPANAIGPKLGYTEEEFIEKYDSDRDAKLNYQKGKTEAQEEILNKIFSQAKDGEFKSIEYLLNNVFTIKQDTLNSKTVVDKKVKKNIDEGVEHLFDPSKIELLNNKKK